MRRRWNGYRRGVRHAQVNKRNIFAALFTWMVLIYLCIFIVVTVNLISIWRKQQVACFFFFLSTAIVVSVHMWWRSLGKRVRWWVDMLCVPLAPLMYTNRQGGLFCDPHSTDLDRLMFSVTQAPHGSCEWWATSYTAPAWEISTCPGQQNVPRAYLS